MDDREAGRYWEETAEVWTALARQGWDIFRDRFNTPAFFDFLSGVHGLTGLDLGCGEGHNARLLTQRCAAVYAIDVAPASVKHAQQADGGIRYAAASAQMLPFADASFDFVTAFMSLMDMPQPERALHEAARVLKPGGFLQFSITRPCFDTPHRRRIRDTQGRTYAREVGGYYDSTGGKVDEWIFHSAPREVNCPPSQVPRPPVSAHHCPLVEHDRGRRSSDRESVRTARHRRGGGPIPHLARHAGSAVRSPRPLPEGGLGSHPGATVRMSTPALPPIC